MSDRPLQLFDSHVHLDRLPAPQSLEEALHLARKRGISGWLIPGVRAHDWGRLFALAEENDQVWAAPGLHPLAAEQWTPQARRELKSLLGHDKALAIGEIGLDRLLDVPMASQEKAFREQLAVAAEQQKPVLIHCRRAWAEVLTVLRREKWQTGGILHAFGGSLALARQGVDLGFAISFGGPLTYPNARRRIEVLQGLPATAVVLETDAPDLPPHPHQRQVNRPEWLLLIAQRVAELRGWSLAETARITTENARRVLGIEARP